VLDLLTAVLIGLFFYKGFRKGLIVALFSFAGLILGMICAVRFSGLLSNWLISRDLVSSGWAALIAYVLIFFGVMWGLSLLAKAIEGLTGQLMLGVVNRVAGGMLYGFMAALVWSGLLWIADRVHLIAPETKSASVTYSGISNLAPWFFSKLGIILPFVKDLFSELQQFFDRADTRLPEHVGAD
jgi:membrane protein required for colicin V production